MENTNIAWTKNTFNPWKGCTKCSDGCKNCFAAAEDKYRNYTPEGWGKGKPRERTTEQYWQNPVKWNEEAKAEGVRKKVFCASLCDVFDDEVDQAWRDDLWKLIRATPHLDWQLLTKRPQNMHAMLPPDWGQGWENMWLGTSVENQACADERIPLLIAVPAKVHFLSVEPLLGPIQFQSLDGIEWVIVGGESGSNARRMEKAWADSVCKQAKDAGIALFFKQWGEYDEQGERVGKKAAGHLLDGVTYHEFPVVTVVVAPDARDLAMIEINQLHGEIINHGRMTLAKAITMGGKITEIKATLKHGQFGKWIASALDFDQQTAGRYMKLFNGREKLKFDTMSNITGALRILDEEKRAKRSKGVKSRKSDQTINVQADAMEPPLLLLDKPVEAPGAVMVHSGGVQVTAPALVPASEIVKDAHLAVLVLEATEDVIAELLEVTKKYVGECQHQVIRQDGQIRLNEYFIQRLTLAGGSF